MLGGEKGNRTDGDDCCYRGFLFGPILALRLGAAFVPVRKSGKLPGKVHKVEYKKEYGTVSTSLSLCFPGT